MLVPELEAEPLQLVDDGLGGVDVRLTRSLLLVTSASGFCCSAAPLCWVFAGHRLLDWIGWSCRNVWVRGQQACALKVWSVLKFYKARPPPRNSQKRGA